MRSSAEACFRADQVRDRDAEDPCVVAKRGLPVDIGTTSIDLVRFQNR
jgi:hypothetical protein